MSEFEFHISPRVQLVTTPDRRRHLRHELEQPPRAVGIGAEAARALDRLGEVGDHAIAPAAHLVTEEPEPACRACADRAFGDDAALGAVAGRIGVISITNRPSGTRTSRTEW
jgi:hypothetical protein